MRKNTLSVLVMLSSTLFVLCRADMQEYIAIDKALTSMSKVVVKYQSEFDTRVKFAALQEAIDSIHESMLDYQGTAKNKLDEIRTLNSGARRTYENCVGPVFEWCVSINNTLDIFVSYIKDERITKHDRDLIWSMTAETLSDGQKKTYNSLELLKLVQERTKDLKNLLDAMLNDLHNDFGPYGFYGKQKHELTLGIAETQKARQALAIVAVIGVIFGAIAALVIGPLGAALALLPMFARLGYDAVIQGNRQATYEEQLRAIEEFFNILNEKINKASEIALQVNIDLKEDKENLFALSRIIDTANRNRKVLLMESPNLQAQLVPSFQNLGKQCYEYTIWHGYGSSGYQQKHSRARRHAIEACNEQRLKALIKETESTSLNITFEALVGKAHSIVKEINCDPRTLLTPPQYKNAESTLIVENDIVALRSPNNFAEKKPTESSSVFSVGHVIRSYSKYL